MRRPALIALLPALLGLAACGWLPPFETVPPAAADSQSEVTQVAVCYNALTATAERVRNVAAASCGPGTVPQRVDHDLTLDHCPLLTPERATFNCAAP